MRTKGNAVAGHGSRRAMMGDLGGMRATRRKNPTELSDDTVQSAANGMEAFFGTVTASMEQNRCVRGDVSSPPPSLPDPRSRWILGRWAGAGVKRV